MIPTGDALLILQAAAALAAALYYLSAAVTALTAGVLAIVVLDIRADIRDRRDSK